MTPAVVVLSQLHAVRYTAGVASTKRIENAFCFYLFPFNTVSLYCETTLDKTINIFFTKLDYLGKYGEDCISGLT